MPNPRPERYVEWGQVRLDEIVTAESRLRLTVEAIEDYARRVQEFKTALPRRGVKQPIGAGIGTVVVDGTGRLRNIHLDVQRTRGLNSDEFCEMILRAIKVGEAKARNLCSQGLKDIADAGRITE